MRGELGQNQTSSAMVGGTNHPFKIWTLGSSHVYEHRTFSSTSKRVSIASNKFHLHRESSGLPQTVQPLSSCKPPSKSLRFTSFSPLYLGVSKPFWRTNPWYFGSDYILHLMPYIPYMSIQCPIIKWLVLQTLQGNSITTGYTHLLRFGQHYPIKTSIDSGFSYIYMLCSHDLDDFPMKIQDNTPLTGRPLPETAGRRRRQQHDSRVEAVARPWPSQRMMELLPIFLLKEQCN